MTTSELLTLANAYEHSVHLWQRIYGCFPTHLSTVELQVICDEFCNHYLRCHGFALPSNFQS